MYNNALFAAYIVKHGEAKAEEWLKGLKANLAQKPSGGDREVARDIAAGKCDIGVANTYYWALMNDKETDKKPWAEATRVILPTFEGGGTHVNLSGVVLVKTSPNKANAHQADRMAGRRKGAADVCRSELRISADRRNRRSTRPSRATARSRRMRCRSPRSPSRRRPPPRSWTRSASTIDALNQHGRHRRESRCRHCTGT